MRNSLKNILLIVFVSIISLGLYQYYQNYNEARSFNNFLDSAALVSSLHLEASEEFKNLLDFSDIKYNVFGPVHPWDRENDNTRENLRKAMAQNPFLKVFIH